MNKPTIVVVGLLPGQVRRVRRECGCGANLKFVDSTNRRPSLPDGDHCVVLVKFISHAWTDLAHAQFSRGRVHYRHGITQTVEAIRGILLRNP